MKNNIVSGVLVCFCFLFVGAGCSSATEESVPEQQDVQVEVSADGAVVIMEEYEEVDKVEIGNRKLEIGASADGILVEDEGALEEDDELKAVVVAITGDNFSFSQKEIRVKKGDTVQIELTSVDGFHDWVVDEFDARTKQVKSGNTDIITFVANRTGSFEYYCSVGSHRQLGMVGKLIVE